MVVGASNASRLLVKGSVACWFFFVGLSLVLVWFSFYFLVAKLWAWVSWPKRQLSAVSNHITLDKQRYEYGYASFSDE